MSTHKLCFLTSTLKISIVSLLLYSVAQASECTVVPRSVEVMSQNGKFVLSSASGIVSPHIFNTQEAAESALEVFEFNGFTKYCVVRESDGRVVFDYFLNREGVPPGRYDTKIEKCEGFIEPETKVFYSTNRHRYQVKSAGEVIVDDLLTLVTADSVANTMRNLHMNASCTIKNSNFIYWKSLFQSLPPADRDTNRPAFFLENLEWNLDHKGFEHRYSISVSDISREMSFEVSYVAFNKTTEALKVSSLTKINSTVLDKSEFVVAPNEKKQIKISKKIIISQIATSENEIVYVELLVSKNDKSYRYSHNDEFLLDVHE